MFRICFLLSLCAFSVAVAVTALDLRFLVPAAGFVFFALVDAYYLGKGRMLDERELPKNSSFRVIHLAKIEGHTVAFIPNRKGQTLVCRSSAAEFTRFTLSESKNEKSLYPV